jgi:hypothetical protein
MTRPLPRNGFGLTAADAGREAQAIEAGMTLLPDSEAVYREWRRIVAWHSLGFWVFKCTMRDWRRHGRASSKPYTDIECYAL